MNRDDTPLPDFRSTDFLRKHIADTMAFYHPRAIDPQGGFFHYFRDDGSVYDASHRHLVSSTRFVFNYAMAAREFGQRRIPRRRASWLALPARGPSRPAIGRLCLDDPRWRSGGPDQPRLRRRLRAARVFDRAEGGHRRSRAVDGRDLGSARNALLGCAGGPVPRRSRRRMAFHRLPRPERQHAHVRGDAGGVRGQRRCALSRSRAAAGRPHDASPGRARPAAWSGSTTTATGTSTGTTTATIPSICSARGVSSPATRPSGPSCC